MTLDDIICKRCKVEYASRCKFAWSPYCRGCNRVINTMLRRWVQSPDRYDTSLREMSYLTGLTYVATQQRVSRIKRGVTRV